MSMNAIHKIFPIAHFIISMFFIVCALALVVIAGIEIWAGIQPLTELALNERLYAMLEGIALSTVAAAALELGRAFLRAEAPGAAQTRAPTRVRRFLSRLMVGLVVAFSIASLVAVFKFSRE